MQNTLFLKQTASNKACELRRREKIRRLGLRHIFAQSQNLQRRLASFAPGQKRLTRLNVVRYIIQFL